MPDCFLVEEDRQSEVEPHHFGLGKDFSSLDMIGKEIIDDLGPVGICAWL